MFTRLAGVLVVAGLVACAGALPAAAQSQQNQAAPPSAIDRVDLVGLTTRQPSPDAPSTQIQFQATVNYRLQSVDSGFVLLFLFENTSNNSSQQSSEAITIRRGSGQLVLNIDYELKPDVRTLTLVAGEFKGEQKLLSWVSTNPIDMGPWPGRVAFEHAMTARLAGDFVSAEQDLTNAVNAAPDTGNYYYWRGDTRVRLNDFTDAAADFDRSIQLMPNDRPSRIGRGIANLWLGQAQAAIDDLSVAIDTGKSPDRSTGWAYRARGLARASLGLSTDAVSDYMAYLGLTPDAADRPQVEGWIADLSAAP
jgi:tetratricopeptide (TPR) repeat protein